MLGPEVVMAGVLDHEDVVVQAKDEADKEQDAKDEVVVPW